MGKQRFQCSICKYRFVLTDTSWINSAYSDYTNHKQTFPELEKKYGKSEKTIRKYFDKLDKVGIPVIRSDKRLKTNSTTTTKPSINLIMDSTYFGRDFGVMVFRGNPDNNTDFANDVKTTKKPNKPLPLYRNLHWKYLKNETVKAYYLGIFSITQKYRIKSFTVDNKGGLIKMLERKYPDIPVQLCQFHMVAIILRYTTRSPKTECGKDLKSLILKLKTCSRIEFVSLLREFLQKHANFLQERNHTNKYIHEDVRSAVTSIQNNLSHLFTYERHPHLNIPKTTNSAEGSFGQWKYKVKLHRGLSKSRKVQMIDRLLLES